MRKKILYSLALAGVVFTAAVSHAQTSPKPIKPKYYRLDVDITGMANCFWDGSDCKVGGTG